MAALTICSTTFEPLGRAQAKALGYADLPLAVIPHPFGTRTRDEIRQLARATAKDIDRLLCQPRSSDAPVESGGGGSALALVTVAESAEAVNALYCDRGWGDGLPVVPPTPARIATMLAQCGLAAGHVVANLAPRFGAATVELIAINAVLAGCPPEHMPLLIAAVDAMAAPQFNLQVVQTSTHPAAVWLVVNGPVARRLAINGGANCLGPGVRANACLGRAIRLIQQNIGGALPGETDRATQGQPGKYTFCCAENEQDSPWEPLHVERGFEPQQSTVTVVAAAGTSNMITHARDADDLLKVIAGTMMVPATLEYVYGGEPWIVLAPEHAQVLSSGGLDKNEVKRRLWELSRMPAARMAAKDLARTQNGRSAELGSIDANTLLPVSAAAEDITLIIAGGPGTHSVFVPVFGTSRSVTRAIKE